VHLVGFYYENMHIYARYNAGRKTSVMGFCLLEIWRHTVWCKDSIISENPPAVFVTWRDAGSSNLNLHTVCMSIQNAGAFLPG